MNLRRSCVLAAVTGLMFVSLAPGQDKPARLTFDVATIKPSQPGGGGVMKPMPGGDGYIAQNFPVRFMISTVYRVPLRQITGGPDWIDSGTYDIEAKADHPYSLDDLHEMFKNLLADRFNLKMHMVTKQGPVYALTVDKSGVKMKPDGTGQDLNIPITFGKNPGEFIGTKVPMKYLCFWLGGQLQSDERPVIDKTGLDGDYDFTLSFLPELPANVAQENLPPALQNLPSIFDALKEQLGLKLQPETGPIDYYVIDHVDRPSRN